MLKLKNFIRLFFEFCWLLFDLSIEIFCVLLDILTGKNLLWIRWRRRIFFRKMIHLSGLSVFCYLIVSYINYILVNRSAYVEVASDSQWYDKYLLYWYGEYGFKISELDYFILLVFCYFLIIILFYIWSFSNYWIHRSFYRLYPIYLLWTFFYIASLSIPFSEIFHDYVFGFSTFSMVFFSIIYFVSGFILYWETPDEDDDEEEAIFTIKEGYEGEVSQAERDQVIRALGVKDAEQARRIEEAIVKFEDFMQWMDRKLTAEFILRFDTLASKFIFVSDVPSVFFDLDFEMELYDKYMMENFKHSVMDVYYFVIKAEEGEIITFNIEKSYAQNLYDNRFVLIKHFFDTWWEIAETEMDSFEDKLEIENEFRRKIEAALKINEVDRFIAPTIEMPIRIKYYYKNRARGGAYLYELCKIGNYDGWARPVIRSWNSITRFKKTTAAEYRLGRLRISNKHRRYIPVKRYYKEAYIKWWWVSEHVPFIVRAIVSLITGFKELWKFKKYSKYFHVKVYFWDFFSIYYGVRKRAPDEGIYVFYGYYWIKKRGYHRLWRKKDKERYSKLPYGFPADYSTDPLYKGFYKGLKIFFLIIFRIIFDWGTREFWLYIFKNSFRFLYRFIRFIFYIPLMIYNIFDYIFLQRIPQWIHKKVMKYWMPHRKKYFKVRWFLHCFFDIIKRPRAYFQTISAVGPYEYHNPYITDHVEEISYHLGFRKSRNKKYFGDNTDWSYISRILRPQIKKTRQRKFFVIWAKKKI